MRSPVRRTLRRGLQSNPAVAGKWMDASDGKTQIKGEALSLYEPGFKWY